MEKDKLVSHWLESADRNAKLAEDLFNLGHYSWCLFMWQLAIEKALKARVVSLDKELLYTHDLVKLAEMAEMELSLDRLNELEEITTYNLEARYEDYKKEFYKKANKEYTDKWRSKCTELYKWIKTKI